jgi:hypothetical protein
MVGLGGKKKQAKADAIRQLEDANVLVSLVLYMNCVIYIQFNLPQICRQFSCVAIGSRGGDFDCTSPIIPRIQRCLEIFIRPQDIRLGIECSLECVYLLGDLRQALSSYIVMRIFNFKLGT